MASIPALQIQSAGNATAGWEVASRPVPPALRPFVAAWTGYREWSPVPARRVEFPSGRAVLIIEFGTPLGVADAAGALARHVGGFFAAIDDGASLTEFVGHQAGVQVNLTPRGARALIATPMHEVARHVIGLPDLGAPSVMAKRMTVLAKRLAEARHWPARFDLVADCLQRTLCRSPDASPLALEATRRIDARDGAVRIDALAKALGYSRKHLHACFLRDVGLSPKRYAELRRFDRLRRSLLDGPTALADLAARLGYADQAHLARDVRRFSTLSPTALNRSLQDPLSLAVHTLATDEVIVWPA